MTDLMRVTYLSHRDRVPFALARIKMPDNDVTFVHKGCLTYRIDDGEPFDVRAGEALFVRAGQYRERLSGHEQSVYTSVIISNESVLPKLSVPTHILAADSYDLRYAVDRITSLYGSKDIHAFALTDAYLRILLFSLASASSEHGANGYVTDMKNYILSHPDGNLTLKEIASHAHISTSYASSVFSKCTGMSMSEYIAEIRVRRAQKMLQYTKLSASAIAEKCGFCDLFYFSRVFKRGTGLSPTEYRKRCSEYGGEKLLDDMLPEDDVD